MSINKQLLIDIGDNLYIPVGLPTISSWNSKKRPKRPGAGTFGYNTQTNTLEYFDGSNWYGGSMGRA